MYIQRVTQNLSTNFKLAPSSISILALSMLAGSSAGSIDEPVSMDRASMDIDDGASLKLVVKFRVTRCRCDANAPVEARL